MSEPELTELSVPQDLNGERLDLALVQLMEDCSRTRAQSIIKSGLLKINGTVCDTAKNKVSAGDVIVAQLPVREPIDKAMAEDIPLQVIYEDEEILVIDKPAGMVVHPAAGNWSGTVVNALLGRDADMALEAEFDPLRPGIVHRLDKDTSGCLVIAKTPKSLRILSKAFEEREVNKTYVALVHGWPLPEAGTIRTTIGRHPTDRKKMTVMRSGEGKDAYTSYRVVKRGWWNGIKVALLKVRIYTGRTHQIRVHMSYKDYPIVGDKLYSRGRSSTARRQMLHAWTLELKHPVTQESLVFESPFPPDFREIVDAIRDEKSDFRI